MTISREVVAASWVVVLLFQKKPELEGSPPLIGRRHSAHQKRVLGCERTLAVRNVVWTMRFNTQQLVGSVPFRLPFGGVNLEPR